jgi:hypothetical protein
VLRNNAANKQTYEQKASVTTLTSAGSYVITITDWKALTALFSSSYMDDTQVEAFEGKYQAAASKYIFDNGTSAATRGDAGTAALLQLFPGMINIYYAPKGTTTYAPLKASSTGTKTLTPIPCP